MKEYRKSVFVVAVLIALLLWSITAMSAKAKDVYPSKPVTIIIAYSPGASLDVTTRALAPYISNEIHANVIISNIPGAGGDIGTFKAYTAKPDGYTLLAWTTVAQILSEYMHEVKYKTLGFTPIAAITRDYPILVGHPETFKNVMDFVKQAKTRSVSIGNNGQFTVNGFQGRLMAQTLGLKVNWVNYSGTTEAMGALAGRHLDAATNLAAAAMPLIRAGKVIPLLMFAKNRVPQFPDVPVPSELGFDMPLLGTTLGIVAPPGMDKEKVKFLENAIMKAAKNPDFVAWMEKASTAERILLSGDAYRREIEELAKVAEKYKNSFANN